MAFNHSVKILFGLFFTGSVYSSYYFGKIHSEKLEKERNDYIHAYIRLDVCECYHTCRQTKDSIQCYQQNIQRIDSMNIHSQIFNEKEKEKYQVECKTEYEAFQKAKKHYQDKKYQLTWLTFGQQ